EVRPGLLDIRSKRDRPARGRRNGLIAEYHLAGPPSGSAGGAELAEGREQDGTESGIKPRLIQYPGDVFSILIVAEADDASVTAGEGQRPGEVVEDLRHFERHRRIELRPTA